jgi:uncharacterized protein (TIGR02246 family)
MHSLTSEDLRGIDELFRAYGEAWERRDAAACAALYAPDGDAIGIEGELLSGADVIERYYARQLAGRYAALTITDLEVDPPRGIAEGVAVQNATWRLVGLRTAPGEMHPVRVRATFVMTRREGRWRYAAARFMVPFEPRL